MITPTNNRGWLGVYSTDPHDILHSIIEDILPEYNIHKCILGSLSFFLNRKLYYFHQSVHIEVCPDYLNELRLYLKCHFHVECGFYLSKLDGPSTYALASSWEARVMSFGEISQKKVWNRRYIPHHVGVESLFRDPISKNPNSLVLFEEMSRMYNLLDPIYTKALKNNDEQTLIESIIVWRNWLYWHLSNVIHDLGDF